MDERKKRTKKRERLRIRLNSKYQKKLRARKPAVPRGPIQVETEQYGTPTVALDFVYYVGDKEKGLSHIIIDEGQVGLHVDKVAASKDAVMYPSGRPINPNEDAERFGKIDLVGRVDELTDIFQQAKFDIKIESPIPKLFGELFYHVWATPKE